jgi:CheY-like chemotaxis protein
MMADLLIPEATASRVLSDSPSLSEIDPLEAEQLAERLEALIVASKDQAPFTVSIEAGWGAGKSTLMRRLQRRLDGRAPDGRKPAIDARTVWFNAWTATESKVLEGLVRSVLNELDSSVIRKAARNRNLLRGLGIAVSIGAGLLRVGNLVDRIWEKTSIDPKQRNELNDFVREAMEAWLAKNSGSNGRLIVVFIDDLDRCTATAVMQVFEAVKLYLDAPGFVFVLGWDTQQVIRAVETERGGDDRLPQRYVEKIIQFGFRLPRPTAEQLVALTEAYCNEAGITTDALGPGERELLIRTTQGNPRQLKRFLNRYVFMEESVSAEPKAIILLMVLQASYDNLYRLLTDGTEEDDAKNPLVVFADYRAARDAKLNRQGEALKAVLEPRGYAWEAWADAEAAFDAFEGTVPRDFLQLVTDALLSDLVGLMTPQDMRAVRDLARSKDLDAYVTAIPPADEARAAWRAAPGTTVLWIDDQPKAEDQALLPEGVSLYVASSTVEALDLYQKIAPELTLVVSDLMREGNGQAGIEGLRELRSAGYQGPAVFFSTRASAADARAAAEEGSVVINSWSDLADAFLTHLPAAPQPDVSKVFLGK